MVLLYMVTFTINIPQMLAHIYHTWILWVIIHNCDSPTITNRYPMNCPVICSWWLLLQILDASSVTPSTAGPLPGADPFVQTTSVWNAAGWNGSLKLGWDRSGTGWNYRWKLGPSWHDPAPSKFCWTLMERPGIFAWRMEKTRGPKG